MAAILLWSVAPTEAQQNQTTPRSERGATDQDAAQLRELADQASRRAADWDALAKAARDTAARTTDPVIKKSWEDGARGHEARAKEQKDEAARLTAQADEKTAQMPKLDTGSAPKPPPAPPPAAPPAASPPPAPSSPVASGEPPKPSDTDPAGQPTATAAGGDCASGQGSPDEALPAETIAGNWQGEDGATIEILPKSPGDTTKFVFKGTVRPDPQWEGSYAGGKLVFSRVPIASEMSTKAPEWARKKVEGQLKWSLELDAKSKCGQPVLEGKWYPGELKFLQEKDADGKIVKQEALVVGKGKPVDVKYTRASAIAHVIVLDEQTGFTPAGKPRKPYPWQASVSYDVNDTRRTLFVYGFNLPKDNIKFTSENPATEYFVLASSKFVPSSKENLADPQKKLFAQGWNQVMTSLDADTRAIAKDMDSVLVQARFGPQMPGIKHFAMNGLDASWHLRFGDDRTKISFARPVTSMIYDETESLLLPERVLVEVRTGGDFPLDEIQLKLQLNKRPITWNGKPTLVARKIPRDKAVDLLRKDRGDPPLPTVYRTDLIEFVEDGKAEGPSERGVYHLKGVKVGDNLFATLEDQFLLGALPPDIQAPILRTPDVLGMTWKDALARAARANKIEVANWSQLPGAEARRISNLIVTKVPAGIVSWLTHPFTPTSDDFTAHVRVTIGDHAALLLFRDEFVKRMNMAIKNLEQVTGDAALRGWRTSIGRELWDDGTSWQYLEVTCPHGGKCPLYQTFSPDFLKKEFDADLKGAEQWSLRAVQEGIGEYKKKVAEASAEAAGVADSDVEKLVRLLGHGYDALLPSLVPRMMRLAEFGAPSRVLWLPELNGRYTLMNLRSVAEEVQTQKDFSKADTAVGLAVVGLISVPALAGEGVTVAWLAAADSTFNLGQTFIAEVPDFVYQRQDVQFALGANLVLGGDRLSEALLKETKWYELFFAVAPAAFQEAFTIYQTAAVIRSARILAKVKAGGLAAFNLLAEVDQAAVLREMMEAKLLQKEYGQAKSLSNSQRSAAEAADVLFPQLGADPLATPKLTPEPGIDALGEAGPRTPLEPEFVPLTPAERTSVYTPSDLPEVKPRFPGGMPLAEQAALVETAPYANTEWKTTFTGKDGKVQRRTFTLERRIGTESVNSRNFRLVNPGIEGCEIGCIIKTIEPGNIGAATDAVEGYNNLLKGVGDDVLQPKLIHAQLDAPRPYIIVEELRPVPHELEIFDINKWNEVVLPAFAADTGLGDALFEATARINEAKLAWPDGHVSNWYFKKVNGKWKAGVLDPDGIAPYEKLNRRVGAITAYKETLCFEHCGSLANSRERLRLIVQNDWAEKKFGMSFDQLTEEQKTGWSAYTSAAVHPEGYFPDLETHTEKMMELNGYFDTNPITGVRTGRLVDPGGPLNRPKWEQKFPKMFRPERLQPIDATTAGGFWNP